MCRADVVESQTAAGLAGQGAGALEPLIVQTGSAGRHAEAGAGAWAVSDAGGCARNNHVFVHGQTGTVGYRTAAHPTDHHDYSTADPSQRITISRVFYKFP